MNMLDAAYDTLALARSHGMDNLSSDNPELDYPHLIEMYNKMIEGSTSGEFSEAKMGRWLGWMQAAVVSMCDEITLEHMKAINIQHET